MSAFTLSKTTKKSSKRTTSNHRPPLSTTFKDLDIYKLYFVADREEIGHRTLLSYLEKDDVYNGILGLRQNIETKEFDGYYGVFGADHLFLPWEEDDKKPKVSRERMEQFKKFKQKVMRQSLAEKGYPADRKEFKTKKRMHDNLV